MDLNAGYRADHLRDLQQIRDLKSQYCARVDALCQVGAAGAAKIGEVFTEDATFDFTSLGGPFARGRREIVEFFESVITPSATWIWHPLSNPVITLEGDRAKAVWMLHAVTLAKTPDARPHHTLGRYYDEYVRTPDGWRQSVFVFKKELEYDQ